jgi:hypothetical protein
MTPEDVLAALGELPSAVLLLGPLRDVQDLARSILLDHHVHPADVLHISKLNADYSRVLVAVAATASYGWFKGVAVCMDGATEQAQNILLKTLEEPPESIRFILYGTVMPLPAIVGRCRVFRLGSGALHLPSGDEGVAGKVASAVRAARTGDPLLLADTLRGWDEVCGVALREWALREARASGDKSAWRVLEVLSRYPRARPINAAAAALSLGFLEE